MHGHDACKKCRICTLIKLDCCSDTYMAMLHVYKLRYWVIQLFPVQGVPSNKILTIPTCRLSAVQQDINNRKHTRIASVKKNRHTCKNILSVQLVQCRQCIESNLTCGQKFYSEYFKLSNSCIEIVVENKCHMKTATPYHSHTIMFCL